MLTKFPMWFGSEIELRRISPAPYLDVVFRTSADRHSFVRHVGNADQHFAHAGVVFFRGLLQFLNLQAHVFGFGD